MRQYFANLPPDQIVPEIKKRWDGYQKWLKTSGFANRIIKNYTTYYGLGAKGSMGLQKSEDGSIIHTNINHHHRLLTLQKQMITANKLSFFAKARVSDSDALAASVLGKATIDFYNEELKLSKQLAKLVETSLVCQKASIAALWNRGKGKAIRPDEMGNRVMSGDVDVKLFTPFDVATTTKTKASPFKIVRQRENRWELMAEHPEYAEYIANCADDKASDETLAFALNFDNQVNDDDDYLYTYTLFHKATLAVPDGLIVKYVGDQILEYDTLTERYEDIPVFELSAGDVIDSIASHGTGVDLVSIQEALTALFTAVVTNNINLAMINVYGKDPNTKKIPIGEGMNLWTGQEPPTALALANSSPETYNLINMLVGQGNMVSGQNDLTSGTVSNTKLTSGNALAVLLTTALQFVSDIQRDYNDVASDVASQIIRNIRLNAKTELVVAISGKTNRSYSKTFQAQDLMGVDRIVVEMQNPVMATQAGRSQIADALLQAGKLDDAEDYVTIITTGDLPGGTDGTLSLKQGIQEENERLKDGEQVPVIISDKHDRHFQSHMALLNDPETRKRPELVSNILDHCQRHIDLWQQLAATNPAMLALLGLQPLPMPQPQDQQQVEDMPIEESNMPDLPSLPDAAPDEAQAQYENFQEQQPLLNQ
jgi:hypothetical protein